MSREDHRRYDQLLQEVRALQKKQPEQISKGDIALWCLAGMMAVALYLAPEKTPLWVCIGLVCMAALATHPVLNIPWIVKNHRILRSTAGMIAMLFIVSLYGWLIWPKRYYSLTTKEREKFIDILRSQKEPREMLIVRCPASNEALCVTATEYLEIFQRTGWKTSTGGIERGTYGKSITGISIAKRPGPGYADPNNPDQGRWVLQSSSIKTLRNAFAVTTIKTTWQADETLQENIISIYFGPIPEN